jgi:phosphoglycerol transferase MdoB-like AlkP superfamily enzyme
MLKYYTIRILAGFLFYGSFGFGWLAYATYGMWIGLVTFIVLVVSGFFLHKVADKLEQDKS